MGKEEEYKEIFLAEALDSHEELNKLFTKLEKNPADKKTIDAIFRITHTVKGNALGMGYEDIGSMAHAMEDLFAEVRNGVVILDEENFSDLFRALDTLGAMINGLKNNKEVRYKGIKTKLSVILRKAREYQTEGESMVQTKDNPGSNVGINEQNDSVEKGKDSIEPDKDKNEEVRDSRSIEEIEEAGGGANEETITFSDLVQVPVRKLDNLLNLVGELIIERDRIIASAKEQGAANEFSRFHRVTSDLQFSVMDVRLVQVGFLFNKFHRVVRDAAAIEKKKVNLELQGTDTEIDRNILQVISDSLIHIARNSVGHGIEAPEVRKKRKKPEAGLVTMSARNENDNVIIEIADDGGGIDAKIIEKIAIEKGLVTREIANSMTDQEKIMYIFEPGFSSAKEVTDISGRGVGMDVVKRSLDTIGGDIKVDTEVGKGSSIKLVLPSSMAVKSSLLFELNDTEFAIPLTYTEAVISLYKKDIHKVSYGLVSTYLDKNISVVFLKDLFELDELMDLSQTTMLHQSYDHLEKEKQLSVVVVTYNGRYVGIVVDRLLQQKEIVEKPLQKPVDNVRFISGVTILGNGNVCGVVNVPSLITYLFQSAAIALKQ